eukprot:12767347-Alexandrium_andersonii.AAC.1
MCGPVGSVQRDLIRRQALPAPRNSGLPFTWRAPGAGNRGSPAATASARRRSALRSGARPGRSVQATTEDASNVRGGGEGLDLFQQAPFAVVSGPPAAVPGLQVEPSVRLSFVPSQPYRVISHVRDAAGLPPEACTAGTNALLQPGDVRLGTCTQPIGGPAERNLGAGKERR